MQDNFKRNLILIIESVIAFFIINLVHFIMGAINPFALGLITIFFSSVFFVTTYLFVKRKEKKSRVAELATQV
jgi:hypothetical protein